jgi:tRNA pseudouridine55 synthase
MLGLLNVYKPKGISSYDVIRQVRRRLGREVKTGHAGTLDPMAEGVLRV